MAWRPASLALALALLGAAGCAAPDAPGAVAAAPAVQAPAPEDPFPPVILLPRQRWVRVAVDPRSGLAQAWLASAAEARADGTRRRWLVANLAEPIRLPETGGEAASVAILADYRCDRHGWRPVEFVWFGRRDARTERLREQPRAREERRVQEGTLVDVFLDAACRR
jgi:hypothetical protein